jgi:hypothetical protein
MKHRYILLTAVMAFGLGVPLASDARMVMMKRRFVLAGMSSPLPKWPEGA